ncbi:MAG: alpha-ketoglutarate-dependent dioxygenase AlkB [Saccharospirillaceae bacterium]|nr:alpha-ketoglutarate-dependent dioxygenase AlkB [Saccharospirillaceae bacterium]
MEGAGGVANPRTNLGPQINCSGSDEHGNVSNVTSEESFKSVSSINTTISVTNTDHLLVPCKLFSDIKNLKTAYSKIVKHADVKLNGINNTELNIDTLPSDQVNAGIKKMKKGEACDALICLMDKACNVCLPTYSQAPKIESKVDFEPAPILNNYVTSQFRELCSEQSKTLSFIPSQLNSLKSSIEIFQDSKSTQSSSPVKSPPKTKFNVSHNESAYKDCVDDFLDQNEADSLINLFNGLEFHKESGHSVLVFGEEYHYTGSHGKAHPFPEPVKHILDKLNQEHSRDHPLNSCLVNFYSGPQSYLPEHSDDETNIDPNSSIFSISIGDTNNINFREVHTGVISTLECKPCSMYTMTRKSQTFFKHEILKNPNFLGIRYSLTFRRVDGKYKNSTCLVGDSNAQKLNFGNGPRTFGPRTPGENVFVPTIDKLKPEDYATYNNVVLMCGINSIRSNNVKTPDDIRNIYSEFKHKIEMIQYLNKNCNIYICPILPTRAPDLNRRAIFMNKLISGDLAQNNYGVRIVTGFDDFLDRSDLLNENLSTDTLHLNSEGTRMLARYIKQCMSLKRRGGTRLHSKRLYSSATKAVDPGFPPLGS